MGKVMKARIIARGGVVEGEALVSPKPLGFNLGVDVPNGIIIEHGHPLEGVCFKDKVFVFPNGKGSSVVQADGMYQLKMTGMEPKAMIIQNPDTTLVASAIIMEEPLVDRVDPEFYANIKDGDKVAVDATNGVITVKEEA